VDAMRKEEQGGNKVENKRGKMVRGKEEKRGKKGPGERWGEEEWKRLGDR